MAWAKRRVGVAVVAHEYPAVEDQGRPTGLLSGQIGHLVFPEENSGPHIQRENHTIGRVADQLIRIEGHPSSSVRGHPPGGTCSHVPAHHLLGQRAVIFPDHVSRGRIVRGVPLVVMTDVHDPVIYQRLPLHPSGSRLPWGELKRPYQP